MSYKVIKDKPIPNYLSRGRLGKYPFKDLKVGDCFEVPLYEDEGAYRKLYNASRRYSKRANNKVEFSVHKIKDKICCWRIK